MVVGGDHRRWGGRWETPSFSSENFVAILYGVGLDMLCVNAICLVSLLYM